jgi:hypothetical protein
MLTPRRTWLQYDGASHFARAVTEFFKDLEKDGKEEVDRWLGLLGHPTLNPLDFCIVIILKFDCYKPLKF